MSTGFWVFFAAAFLIPYQLFGNTVLNIFYHQGAWRFDSGLMAALFWRSGWSMHYGIAFDNIAFPQVHLAPFVWLVSGLSYLIPTTMVGYFAGFMGVMYASFSAVMYVLLVRFFHLRIIWALLLSLGYGFNGLVTDSIWLPHYEFYISIAIILFLIFLALKRYIPALCFFLLALSTREDAGLHIDAFLGLLILWRLLRKEGIKAQKWELSFFITALLWSIAAAILKATYFHSLNLLEELYYGNPPYAHVTWPLMKSRLLYMLYGRCVIWQPFLITLIWWAFHRREAIWLVGFFANIPWFLLGFFAAAGREFGKLYSYYSFPFDIALIWPLLAMLLQYGRDIPLPAKRSALILQALVIAVSIGGYSRQGWHWYPLDRRFLLEESAKNREIVEAFRTKLENNLGELGNVHVDEGILSLSPHTIDVHYSAKIIPSAPLDSLVFFKSKENDNMKMIDEQAVKYNLYNTFQVTGTDIFIRTNRNVQQLPDFSGLLSKPSVMP